MKITINKSIFLSLFFLLVFIAPRIVYSIIPENQILLLYIFVCFGYLLCGLYLLTDLTKPQYLLALLLTLSFLLFGGVNAFLHKQINFFNFIAPVAAYLGLIFFNKYKCDLRVFDWFIVFLYIFFIIVYYSELPNFFFRPGFDEDTAFFDNASSNAIPISLNILLYAYIIFNRLLSQSNQRKIIFFSLINLILIIIQQSRGGIAVALLILFVAILEFNKRHSIVLLFIFAFISVVCSYVFLEEILFYTDAIGNVNGISAFHEDVRGRIQLAFFKNMDFYSFFSGYLQEALSESIGSNIRSTFNVFLEVWNKYGIFQVIIFLLFLGYRILNGKKYDMPLYIFAPFIFYALIEAIFFPNLWDTIIYVLLFYNKKNAHIQKNKCFTASGKKAFLLHTT